MQYAKNKGADQPAHLRSLISTFVFRCLDSIISLVSIYEISSLYLASVAVQAGLSIPLSQTPKTGFLLTRLKLYRKRGISDVQLGSNTKSCCNEQCYKEAEAYLVIFYIEIYLKISNFSNLKLCNNFIFITPNSSSN